MASRAASGSFCRRGDRWVGPVDRGEELSWQRVGQLSSGVIVGPVSVRLHDGVFSSRKLERATYDSVAFRFIAANDHPDHDTISSSPSPTGPTRRSPRRQW